MADDFINYLLAPTPNALAGFRPIASRDEWGNPYDAQGRPIQQHQQSGWENAADWLQAPVNFGAGLVDSFVPVGDKGEARVPPVISAPMEAGQRFLGSHGGMWNIDDPQNSADAMTLLLTGFGGNAFGGMKAAKAGMAEALPRVLSDNKPSLAGAAASSLDMSPEARLARAREQGFDTDRVLYHGTQSDFDRFNAGFGGYGSGVYMADNPELASMYAERRGTGQSDGAVLPLHVRGQIATQAEYNQAFSKYWAGNTSYSQAAQAAMEDLASKGFQGAEHGVGDVLVFDPSNIRSVNAAFDPTNIGKNGLLLSDNSPSLLGSALASLYRER